MKTKAASYIRVSTSDQANFGLSLQAQRDLIQAYADSHDIEIVGVYADEGISAAKSLERREALLRMLEDAEAGLFSVVLFKDITRWSRNAAQYYRVQERLDKCKVGWIAIEQPYLETVSPTGKFQVSVMLGTSQLESDNTAARIKFTQDAEVRRGYFPFPPHCAPLGYTTEKRDGHNHLIVDEKHREDVKRIFDAFLKSGNASVVGRELGIPHQNIIRTLNNRVYIGEFRGIKGFCEPIISEEEFDRVQRLLKHHSYTSKHSYIFSGLAFCGFCGEKMKWNCPDDKYPMCRCVNCRNTITEKEMERQVIETVEPELNRYRLRVKSAKKPVSRKTIEGKLSRLKDLYIDGLISREQFDIRRAEFEEQLKEAPPPPELPVKWKDLYGNLSKQKKNVLWKSVIQSISVKDKKINISFSTTKVLAERMAMLGEAPANEV